MEQCAGCRFWLNWDTENTNLGECHRYPPRMVTVQGSDPDVPTTETARPENGGWPLTYPDDWCGEFQRPLTQPAPSTGEPEPRKGESGPVI
jgi:hypothetical protein